MVVPFGCPLQPTSKNASRKHTPIYDMDKNLNISQHVTSLRDRSGFSKRHFWEAERKLLSFSVHLRGRWGMVFLSRSLGCGFSFLGLQLDCLLGQKERRPALERFLCARELRLVTISGENFGSAWAVRRPGQAWQAADLLGFARTDSGVKRAKAMM